MYIYTSEGSEITKYTNTTEDTNECRKSVQVQDSMTIYRTYGLFYFEKAYGVRNKMKIVILVRILNEICFIIPNFTINYQKKKRKPSTERRKKIQNIKI